MSAHADLSADTLRRLRETLVALFPKEIDARRILTDACIPTEHVELGERPVNLWFSAVEEARKARRLDALVELAAKDYPKQTALKEIAEALRRLPSYDPTGRMEALRSGEWKGRLAHVVPLIEPRESAEGRRVSVAETSLLAPFHDAVEVAWIKGPQNGAYLLAVLESTPDAATVDAFVAQCRAWQRERGLTGWNHLLHLGDPCDASVLGHAADCEVDLQCLAEYGQRLVDLREYVRVETENLAHHDHYNPDHYITARITRLVGTRTQPHEDALAAVREWMAPGDARVVVILGDFGTGKTFLLRETARRLGLERRAGKSVPIPLLIEMREMQRAKKLDGLLSQHLADHDVRRFDLDALRHMIREGQVVLLFDGFDELAQRITFDRAADHLKTLMEAVEGRARVLLTSRSQHFHSDDQVLTELDQIVRRHPYVLARLERFETDQIRAFFAKTLGEDERSPVVDERMTLLQQVEDLAGLGQNPRMLSFIAQLPVDTLKAAAKREGSISSAGLYQLLIEQWLAHERKRREVPGSKRGMTDAQLMACVDRLALKLWGQVDRFVARDELRVVVQEGLAAVPDPPHELNEATHQVGSASVLSRQGEDRFTFFHQSVMEWVVARQVAHDWKEDRDSPLVVRCAFTDLMPKFLVEMVGDGVALRRAKALESHEEKTARENATRVLARVRVPTVERLDLHGQDLRTMDLSTLRDRLAGADLRDCILSGLRLREWNLRGADLRGAKLVGTDFTRADLTSADLRGADLTGAKCTGAQMGGAHFEAAVLARVSFVGAQVDDAVVARAVALGGAPRKVAAVTLESWPATWVSSVAVEGTGRLLAIASGSVIVVLDWESGTVLRTLRGHVGCSASTTFPH